MSGGWQQYRKLRRAFEQSYVVACVYLLFSVLVSFGAYASGSWWLVIAGVLGVLGGGYCALRCVRVYRELLTYNDDERPDE